MTRKPLNKPFNVTRTIKISFSGVSVGDGVKTVFPVMILDKITDKVNGVLSHAQFEGEIKNFTVIITSEQDSIEEKKETLLK